jgi:ricin-type beta-trefoil lectin protein
VGDLARRSGDGGSIGSWPLRAASAGPFPAGTGTVAGPFNGMCMTLAADGATVVAWKCSPGASSQQWTGYSDGTLRITSRCLDVTGPGAGANVQVAACTGAASQKWEIGQVSYNNFGPITNAGTGTVLSYPRGASPTAPRWSWDPTAATRAAHGTSPSATT